MSGAVVHSNNGNSGGNVTSFNIAYATGPSTNNQLVAVVTSIANNITWTLSDSVNGSWPTALYTTTGNAHSAAVFCLGATNAGGTPTVTVTPSASSLVLVTLIEASGITGTLDKSVNATTAGSQTTLSIGPTASLTTANDLVIAALQAGTVTGGWSAGSSYTLITPASGNSEQGVSWLTATSTGGQSTSFSWTTATNGLGIVAALTASVVNTTLPFSSTQFFVSDRVTYS